jgi:hypothetical protein
MLLESTACFLLGGVTGAWLTRRNDPPLVPVVGVLPWLTDADFAQLYPVGVVTDGLWGTSFDLLTATLPDLAPSRQLLITSADPAHSWVSANLAVRLVEEGKRVLLIDGNPPTVQQVLPQPPPGLTVKNAHLPFEDLMNHTHLPYDWVLACAGGYLTEPETRKLASRLGRVLLVGEHRTAEMLTLAQLQQVSVMGVLKRHG